MKTKNILVMAAIGAIASGGANAATRLGPSGWSSSTKPACVGGSNSGGTTTGNYGGSMSSAAGTIVNSAYVNSTLCSNIMYLNFWNGETLAICNVLANGKAQEGYEIESIGYEINGCYTSVSEAYKCVTKSCTEGKTTSTSNNVITTTDTKYSCNYGCKNFYEYNCATGYYGTPTSSTSGCTKCPGPTDWSTTANAMTSPSTGATSVSQCVYIPGTSFSTSSGSGTLTAACFY